MLLADRGEYEWWCNKQTKYWELGLKPPDQPTRDDAGARFEMRACFPGITGLSRLGDFYLAETDITQGANPIEYWAHPQQHNPYSQQQNDIAPPKQGSSQQGQWREGAGESCNHCLTYRRNVRCDRARPACNQCVEGKTWCKYEEDELRLPSYNLRCGLCRDCHMACNGVQLCGKCVAKGQPESCRYDAVMVVRPNPVRAIGSQAGRKRKSPMTAEEKQLVLVRKYKQCRKKRCTYDGELPCDICLKEKKRCVYVKEAENVVVAARNCEPCRKSKHKCDRELP